MLGNFGPGMLMRSKRGRASVTQWKWWGVTRYCLAVGAAVVGIVAWAYFAVVGDRSSSLSVSRQAFRSL
jgi:hypothetical protein